jgi:hypothetical protein
MSTWDGYNRSIIANRFQKSFMVNYVDLSGRLLVRQDASFNNRLFVINDASFMGNVYVDDILTANLKFTYNNDVSLNQRLFVQNDASFMGNIYVDDILTTNLKMISIGDTSLNSNVVVGRDISCNGNINIGRNITVLGNIAIKNYTATNVINTTTTNYSLAVVEDISLNGRVTVSSDTSLNGNLFVSRDMSLNGNVNVNSSVSIVKDISVNGMKIGKGANNALYTTYLGNTAVLGLESNTAMGYQSLNSLVSGVRNTALGYQALYSTTNDQNTAVGYQSLRSTTSGTTNVAIGYQSGYNNITGNFNTYIGYGADASAATYTVSTAVGANSSITGNSQIVLGRPSETVIIPRILRYSTPPLWIRTALASQSFTLNSETPINWATENYKSPYMPLSINSVSPYDTFTNSTGSTLSVGVSASFSFAGNTSGARALWIILSSTANRISFHFILPNPSNQSTSLNVSGNFILNNTDWFQIRGLSSVTTSTSGDYNGVHPSRVIITVF